MAGVGTLMHSALYICLCDKVTLALAESIALRAAIKPVTFPFKIWASYTLVLASKAQRRRPATASICLDRRRSLLRFALR